MSKVKQKDLILYSGLIILGLAAPYLFSAFKVQLTYLCVLIVLAMTWNLQGGEMGYNTFGNILFYGLGMYLTASVQVGMFFPLAEWTESGGEKTFVHTTAQYFQGIGVGLLGCSYYSCNCRRRYRLRYFRFKRSLFCDLYFRTWYCGR
jgi:branched-chain amino acid transport system permease protein